MRKLLSLFLSVTTLVTILCCAGVPIMSGSAYYDEYGEWVDEWDGPTVPIVTEPTMIYESTKDLGDGFSGYQTDYGVVIQDYTGSDKCTEIPEEINGMPVVGIRLLDNADRHFAIQEENGVKYCGNWVLGVAYNLREKVYLKEGTRGIAYRAFAELHDRSAKDITIHAMVMPDSVEYIGESAFYDCYNLTEITLSKNLKFIGEMAFNFCNSLENITLPNSLTIISAGAFSDCPLTSITLPDSLTFIGDGAFYNCSLTSVTLPKGITQVYSNTFFNCPLSTVYIPINVKSISYLAFDRDWYWDYSPTLTDVYYEGSEQQWYTEVETSWDVSGITMHYNWVPPTEPTVAPTTEPTVEPTTEPTEPYYEPTEPYYEPTEPYYEPTEPYHEPTSYNTDNVTVFFPEVNPGELSYYSDLAFQLPDVTVKEGATDVRIPVRMLKNKSGLYSCVLILYYDPSVLMPKELLSPYFHITTNVDYESGSIKFVMDSKDSYDSYTGTDDDVLVFYFDVIGSGNSSSSLNLENPDPEAAINAFGDAVNIETLNGSLEVEALPTTTTTAAKEILYGDANNDGMVNMKDVLAMRKYVADLPVELDFDAADTNGDGAVNMKDILTVRKYIADLIDFIDGGNESAPTNNLSPLSKYSTMFFGTYEQDGDYIDGVEPIEWLVLENDGETKLLLSRYVLDCRTPGIDPTNGGYAWDRSGLWTWLNESFYNSAFSIDEQNKIIQRTVTTESLTSEVWTLASMDKVSLLSAQELEQYFDITNDPFGNQYSDALIAEPSFQAGEKSTTLCTTIDETWLGFTQFNYSNQWMGKTVCPWLLRTPGGGEDTDVSYVNEAGVVCYDYLYTCVGGIRPVICISCD